MQPMNQSGTLGRKTPRHFGPGSGILVVLAWFALFMGVMFLLYVAAWYMVFAGLAPALILLGVAAFGTAFLVALKVERAGWMLSLSLAILVVFGLMPLALSRIYGHEQYLWTVGSSITKAYVIGILVLIAAPLLGYLAVYLARYRGWRTFNLSSPYLAVAFPLVICMLLSMVVFAWQHEAGPPGGILKYEGFNFQVKLPGGWSYEDEDELLANPQHDYSPVTTLYLRDKPGGAAWGFPGATIVASRIVPEKYDHYDPKGEVPVSQFTDADSCYEAIEQNLKETKKLTYTRKPDVKVAGTTAMHAIVPGRGDTYYIFKLPYVYMISFDSDEVKDFDRYQQQILDSFEVIP